MVERKEVEALLQACKRDRIGPHPDNETLAALCRAWLAVQDAPVGVVDILTGWDDGSGAIEVHYESGRPDIDVKERVRIVREGE